MRSAGKALSPAAHFLERGRLVVGEVAIKALWRRIVIASVTHG
jgi:hypothetical protein